MLNKVAIMGRITRDLELKTTTNGNSVVSFSIATDRNYKENGEFPTDFFEVVAWRKTAEFICNYFGKGQLIAIEGTLQTRKFTDNNNVERKVTEILIDGAHFCGGKKSEGSENSDNTAPNGNATSPPLPQDDGEFHGMPTDFNPFA